MEGKRDLTQYRSIPKNLQAFAGGNSDDDEPGDEKNKMRRKPIQKEVNDSAIDLIRRIRLSIFEGQLTNEQKKQTRIWNNIIIEAYEERYSTNLTNWRKIGRWLLIAAELTTEGTNSSFFELVKQKWQERNS